MSHQESPRHLAFFERYLTVWVFLCMIVGVALSKFFPGAATRLHWSFPDPFSFQGTPKVKLEFTRQVRDKIKAKVEEWCAEVCHVEV